ncbi:hypothetical protein C3F00_031960 [Pseudomonas sp. MWU13-2860]|nr:hypothetical protein C3F00_031960 [Pseudomonas sp. MWU13-2860]
MKRNDAALRYARQNVRRGNRWKLSEWYLVWDIRPELEAAYVNKHGDEGQRFIEILLGRKETIASVNKNRMNLED